MWKGETIKFSGVPLVVLSFKTFDCYHGVDINTTVKKQYKETKDLLLYWSN